MRAVLKGAIATALIAGTSLAGTAPAQARYYGHDHTGAAIAAGIIGLGVGAAIASDHRDYRPAYYGYDSGPAYYAPAPVYYGGDYGYGGYGYDVSYDYGRRYHDDRRGWDDHRGYDRGGYDRGGHDRDRGGHDRGGQDRGGWDHDRR